VRQCVAEAERRGRARGVFHCEKMRPERKLEPSATLTRADLAPTPQERRVNQRPRKLEPSEAIRAQARAE
jgi:hypothetical protein